MSLFLKQPAVRHLDRIRQGAEGDSLSMVHRSTIERVHRVIAAIAGWLRRHLGLSQHGGLGDRIAQAGLYGEAAGDVYTAARIVGPVIAFVCAMLIPTARVFWMLALPATAYILPDMLLEYFIRRRRTLIRKSLPDAIDLLVICVDAGLGVDQAMMRVAQELVLSAPELHAEMMQINHEQRAGKPRLEAWQAMVERTGIPDVAAFVNMLVQTERFGTPLARALRNFALGVRLKRTQKAEENAAKTTIKIIFPLVIFIFPCLFIVLLGPAGIAMMRNASLGF